MTKETLPSSFRDPSGFLFFKDGLIYRQVNTRYREDYDHLIDSGLYQHLLDSELIIPHEEIDIQYAITEQAYKIIKPEPIQFISYPYEWCFSQLKDAALTTLEIQKKSLDYGMSLKDCSAYNIQFNKDKPILIDTLSFERYPEGQPWVAYRQFCQHFLAPLVLMKYVDIRLNQLLRVYIDGVPLDLASSLLPFRTRFNFPLLFHVHLHARAQKRFADKPLKTNGRKMSRLAMQGLVDNLKSAIKKLRWKPQDTEWADYYKATNYGDEAFQHKIQLVAELLDDINPTPQSVWDLGSNTGVFSRIAAGKGMQTVSFDMDPMAVEKNYLERVKKGESNILPLVLDLTNPSPDLGWANEERMSFLERAPADTVLALAIIHHLAISNNLPFNKIAEFFSRICKSLIIEFVPKNDSQVQRLLSTREDIFCEYTLQCFEKAFSEYFTINKAAEIKGTERILYIMEKKQ